MSLTETFAALGDPTRLAILERLAEGDATVTELAEPFSVSLPTSTTFASSRSTCAEGWRSTSTRR